MNWSEEKIIRLVHMSQVIKMIEIISHNRFSNISSYINKVDVYNVHLHGFDIIDAYNNSIVKMYFYKLSGMNFNQSS